MLREARDRLHCGSGEEGEPEEHVGGSEVAVLLLDQVSALIVNVGDLRFVERRVICRDLTDDLDKSTAGHGREVPEEERVLLRIEVVTNLAPTGKPKLGDHDSDRSEQREERTDRDRAQSRPQRMLAPTRGNNRQHERRRGDDDVRLQISLPRVRDERLLDVAEQLVDSAPWSHRGKRMLDAARLIAWFRGDRLSHGSERRRRPSQGATPRTVTTDPERGRSRPDDLEVTRG